MKFLEWFVNWFAIVALSVLLLLVITFSSCDARVNILSIEPVATTKVTMTRGSFEPKVIKVKRGDSVTWTNTSTFWHNVNLKLRVSPMLQPESSWTFTFKEPGVYDYWCDPHRSMGMEGTVVVE